WIGERVARLGKASGVRIAYLNRLGSAVLPDTATVIQESDVVHAIMRIDEREHVLKVFGTEPQE
ncbi:MAG: Trk system potassium uptake protein trkA, partial [Actinomycetota bacterium]